MLAHARVWTLPIEIERICWRSIPREEKLSKQCNLATVDNVLFDVHVHDVLSKSIQSEKGSMIM